MMKNRNCWKNDEEHIFRIDPRVVANYFNKRQVLNFSRESAKEETDAIMPFLELSSETKILDLGCGDGRWAGILIPKCGEYVGVDLAEKFIEKAKLKYPQKNVRFLYMFSQDYIDDQLYDYILIIGLITYMNDEDIEKMARNCHKMLARNGRVIIRSVTLKEAGTRRKVYRSNFDFVRRLMGRPAYQIIRRSAEEELRMFNQFELEYQTDIQGTGYTFHLLRHKETI